MVDLRPEFDPRKPGFDRDLKRLGERVSALEDDQPYRAESNPLSDATNSETGIPAQVTGLSVDVLDTVLVMRWTPTVETDWKRYDVQVSLNANFDAVGVTSLKSAEPFFVYGGGSASTAYWVRVRSVEYRDRVGPWSAVASVTTDACHAFRPHVWMAGGV